MTRLELPRNTAYAKCVRVAVPQSAIVPYQEMLALRWAREFSRLK